MLSCKKLSAAYISGKNSFSVLNEVSVELNPGELVCLAGPNGTGKSTLLKLLSGLEGKKSSGLKITSADQEPSIDTQKISALSRKECARKIGYMMQSEYSAWDTTVLDTILTGRFAWSGTNYSEEDFEIAKKAAEQLNISHLLDRSVYELSGGEFQKVRIARSLAQKTEYLLLDEPCAALDLFSEPELMAVLKDISRQFKLGILISIHNLNLAAQFADKIILLPPDKPSVSGSIQEIFTQEIISQTYNHPVKIYNHPILNIPQI